MVQMVRGVALGLTWLLLQQVPAALRAQEIGSKVPGQAAAAEPGTVADARSSEFAGDRRPLYRLGQSDVLELTFEFASEFNQTVTVQPDGYITPKGIRQLYVQGKTLPQLQDALTEAYAVLLHDPRITLVLKDFEKPYFIAAGQVARPGKYELRSSTTLTEAVAIAGGLTEQSKHSQVVLFRRVTDDVVETRVLDMKKMLRSRDLNEEVQLRPRDMIYVPQNTISKLRRYLPVPTLGMYMNSAQF